ncbi:hypothetical protein FRB99_000589 [Tulasnella sp. 403]|nr:hypothetical protein FRB99_000589 [Tulasnella sp. 403]
MSPKISRVVRSVLNRSPIDRPTPAGGSLRSQEQFSACVLEFPQVAVDPRQKSSREHKNMGQRHQFYAISRGLNGKYMCVAAFHHQWLYGHLVGLAAVSAINDIKRHAYLIKQELRCLRYANYDLRDTMMPCPFLWHRLRKWYGKATLGVYHHPLQGDNNDGITVLDVTNPCSPSVCFVNIGTSSSELRTLPVGIPLTAERYIRHYLPLPRPDDLTPFHASEYDNGEKALEQLANVPLLSRAVLDATWPDSIFKHKDTDGEPPSPLLEPVDDPVWITKALTLARDDPEVLRLSKEADGLQQDDKPLETIPDILVPMIIRAIQVAYEQGENPKQLDISCLNLEPHAYVQIVEAFPDATSLSFSGCRNITTEAIASIFCLDRPKPFKELILFHTPWLHEPWVKEGCSALEELRDAGVFKSTKVYNTHWSLEPIIEDIKGGRFAPEPTVYIDNIDDMMPALHNFWKQIGVDLPSGPFPSIRKMPLPPGGAGPSMMHFEPMETEIIPLDPLEDP